MRRRFLPPRKHGNLYLNPLLYRHPTSTGKVCYISWANDSAVVGQRNDQLYLYANVWNEAINRYEVRFEASGLPSVNESLAPSARYVLHQNGEDVWVVLSYTDAGSGDRKVQVWLLTETGFTTNSTQPLFRQTDNVYYAPAASLDGTRWAFVDDTKLRTYSFDRTTGVFSLQRMVDGGSSMLADNEPRNLTGVLSKQLFAMASDNRTLLYLSSPPPWQELRLCALDVDASVPVSRIVDSRGANTNLFQPPFCAPNGNVYWLICDDPFNSTPITLMEARIDAHRASGVVVRSFVPDLGRHRIPFEAPQESYNTAIQTAQSVLLGYPHKQRSTPSLCVSSNGLKESPVGASIGLPVTMRGVHFRYEFKSRYTTTDTSALGMETPVFASTRTVKAWAFDSAGALLFHDSARLALDSVRSSRGLSYIRSGLEPQLGFSPTTVLCGADTIVDTLRIKTKFGVVAGQGFAALMPEDSVVVMKVPVSRYAPHSAEPDLVFANAFAGASIWDMLQDTVNVQRPRPNPMCPGDSQYIEIGSFASWHNQYTWNGFPAINPVRINGPGTYLYSVRYSRFCPPYHDSVLVPRGPSCITALLQNVAPGRINNVVTANGDGVNEFLEIPGEGPAKLQLYNRWSQCVYQTDKYSSDWPKAEVPSGVYYFTATRQGKSFKGWVEVVR